MARLKLHAFNYMIITYGYFIIIVMCKPPLLEYTHTYVQYTIINLLANYKFSKCNSNLFIKSVRVRYMAISEGNLFHIRIAEGKNDDL